MFFGAEPPPIWSQLRGGILLAPSMARKAPWQHPKVLGALGVGWGPSSPPVVLPLGIAPSGPFSGASSPSVAAQGRSH